MKDPLKKMLDSEVIGITVRNMIELRKSNSMPSEIGISNHVGKEITEYVVKGLQRAIDERDLNIKVTDSDSSMGDYKICLSYFVNR